MGVRASRRGHHDRLLRPQALARARRTDIGYRLHPDYWGKGLATEAARATLRYGFETLALDEVIALVLPGNAASIRVLEKLGMARTEDVTYSGERVQRWVVIRRPSV